MGTWGDKPFENDAALDLLSELEGQSAGALRSVFDQAIRTGDDAWLELDDGAAAIAAAALVAASSESGDDLPEAAARWLAVRGAEIGVADRSSAAHAVKRVLAENSELASLWDEVAEDSAWFVRTRELLARLGDGAPEEIERTGNEAEEGEGDVRQMIEALLSFVTLRGLEPTPSELAQISAERDRARIQVWLARASSVETVAALLSDA